MVNGVGVVDSDYFPKTAKMPLYNTKTQPYIIKAGERIGQFIFEDLHLTDDDEPLEEERTGGFGSTGKN